MNSPTLPPDDSTETGGEIIPLGHPATSTTPAEGATGSVTEDRIVKLFGRGGNFNACLLELYPMVTEEIEKIRKDRGFGAATSEGIHTIIAGEKLRENGLFDTARFAYIEAARDRYLKKAQGLIENGKWKMIKDAATYLMNGDDGVECTGFINECIPLFDLNTYAEDRTQWNTIRDLIVTPLREELDVMFAPLHAVMHLEAVERYLAVSPQGILNSNDYNVLPFDALQRLTESLQKAHAISLGNPPETYFSATKMPDDEKAPQTTFAQASNKARDLARILIKTEYETTLRNQPSKETFSTRMDERLGGTGFTLENCGFGLRDITSGIFKWKKVVGFKLIKK